MEIEQQLRSAIRQKFPEKGYVRSVDDKGGGKKRNILQEFRMWATVGRANGRETAGVGVPRGDSEKRLKESY